MKEIKLIKDVEFGKLNFKVAVNRAMFLEVNKKYPEFFKKTIEFNQNKSSLSDAISNGNLQEFLEYNDYVEEKASEIIKFALPLMLKEAEDKSNPLAILDYAEKNNAETLLNTSLLGFLLEVFTKGEKLPKVKLLMK
jgi:hypothetical protein